MQAQSLEGWADEKEWSGPYEIESDEEGLERRGLDESFDTPEEICEGIIMKCSKGRDE